MSFVECVMCGCQNIPEGGQRECKEGYKGNIPNDCKGFKTDVEVIIV